MTQGEITRVGPSSTFGHGTTGNVAVNPVIELINTATLIVLTFQILPTYKII